MSYIGYCVLAVIIAACWIIDEFINGPDVGKD